MGKQNQQQALSPEKYIRTRARTLPLGTCYINANWRDSGLAAIFVTRRHINGHITHAAFMVDIFCLGLKESFWTFNQHPLDFKEFIENRYNFSNHGTPLIKTDYVLVHNIIYGAIEYAGELGFLPHKSFETSKFMLEEDDDLVDYIEIAFGYKGRPLYISGEGNPAERNRVIAQLDRNPGRGRYDFITEADAPEFFMKEEEKEREEANYQDPEVKRGLVSDFKTLAEGPFGTVKEDAGKLKELISLSDTIFYEYMVTEAELDKAAEIIEGLFGFNISDEIFSDEMLAGTSPGPVSHQEIKIQAERLYSMLEEGPTTDGLRQSKAMMDKYPGFPVFIFLYMRFLELKDKISKLYPKLEKYVIQFPGYLPLLHMFAVSFLLNKPEDTSRHIGDSLHLKNFYPQRQTFSEAEALLYIHVLTINYSNSGEFHLIEEMISFIDNRFPGLMPQSEILMAKLLKIPHVMEWCESQPDFQEPGRH
ncbi:MAG: hypothetical protein PHP04_12980 [Bacteroidales bacterium]|nr:hypothetical protein [Bacteroidales bacterium]HNW74494.1 hypothetical protein [Bacteroidales bacterium]HPS50321.1 hypothetical protein [Bacteroidales bacterium]